MEDNYRQSRADLDDAIDGELGPLRGELNVVWWDLHEATARLSALITRVGEAQLALARLTRETREDPLPFDTVQPD